MSSHSSEQNGQVHLEREVAGTADAAICETGSLIG
jgi:hypothetical protein